MSDNRFVIFSNTEKCAYCKKAVALLRLKNQDFDYRDISDPENLKFLKDRGFSTIPQIYSGEPIEENLIGGYDELVIYYDNQ